MAEVEAVSSQASLQKLVVSLAVLLAAVPVNASELAPEPAPEPGLAAAPTQPTLPEDPRIAAAAGALLALSTDPPPDTDGAPFLPIDWPFFVDEDGDSMTGDLAFGNGLGVQLGGTRLTANPALTFGSLPVCLAGSTTAGCNGGDVTGVLAGSGLTGGGLSGDVTLAVNQALIQNRVSGVCAAGFSIRVVAQDGTVTCEQDDDTTYTAGTGLNLVGTVFSVNTGAIQNRVVGTCSVGSSIRIVAQDGTVTCEADDDTTYGASNGLALTGTTFRLLDCNTNQVPKAGSGGTWACGADLDTTYTAGSGLTLNGTQFSVNTGTIQNRVTGTCATGNSIRAVAQDGTVTCEADDDTTYSAGTGLLLSGTSFSVNATAVQSRVTGTCSVGSYVRAVALDGTVTCGTDANSGGTVTSITGGTGLTGGTITSSGTLAVDSATIQNRVTGTCAAGNYVRGIAQDGTVTCQADADTNSGGTVTNVGSGSGLTGGPITGSGTLSIATGGVTSGMIADGTIVAGDADTTSLQRRVSATCPAGSSIRGVAQDGTVTCEADDDTDTTYTAGTGLTLTGTTFARDPAVVQNRVTGTCAAGNSIRIIAQDGTVTCQADTDSGGDITAVSAGTGLTGGGTTGAVSIAVDTTAIQNRVTGTCAAGNSIRAVAQDGTVTCEADDDTTYGAGAGLALSGSTFKVKDCTSSEVLKSGGAGVWNCSADANAGGDVTGVTAGTGLSGGGTSGDVTLSVNAASIQSRVTGTCTAGNSIRAVAQDGTVTCEADDDTTYTASSPISLSGASFGLSSAGCGAGEVWKWSGSAWSCDPDADTDTTYGAGDGLALSGTTFSVQDCAASQVLKRNAGDTAWACAADADTDTTYTAGTALALSGTTFNLGTTGCVADEVWKYDGTTWNCVADADTNSGGDITGVTAGTGLSGGGATGDVTLTLAAPTNTNLGGVKATSCSGADKATGIDTAGTITCASDTDTTYIAGTALALSGTTFNLGTTGCVADEVWKYDGTTWNCVADAGTTYSAGTGLTLTGTIFAVDTAAIQNRVTGTCADGSAVDGVTEAGGVTCENLWRRAGNAGTVAGTDFLGTTDNVALEFKVNNTRALRVEPASVPNIVGGSSANAMTPGVIGGTIGGGGSGGIYNHEVTDNFGTVGGGYNNTAGDSVGGTGDEGSATVGGGSDNVASKQSSTVAGGAGNRAEGDSAAVGGGYQNKATGIRATVAGGHQNNASAGYATVAGGYQNSATAAWATVAGGDQNSASGLYSFAAGRQAKANHVGTFVWADSQAADFASSEPDAFLIRAQGGVGIGNTAPAAQLHVSGDTQLDGDLTLGSDTDTIKFAAATGATDPMIQMFGGCCLNANRTILGHSSGFPDWGLRYVDGSGNDRFVFGQSTTNNILTVDMAALNVGIGTEVPARALHIVNNPSDNYQVARFTSDGTSGSGLNLESRAAGGRSFTMVSTANAAGAGGGKLGVYDETAGAYRMVIDATGAVGIGTNAPLTPLHVAGDVRWTGTLQDGSVPWARLSAFPAACPAGQFASAVGPALTCAVDGTGTDWGRTGNAGTTPGTNFLGTTDNVALELKVNGQRALRIVPGSTPSVLAGHALNALNGAGSAVGAAIGGGGSATTPNRANDNFTTVAGGLDNWAGTNDANTDNSPYATVGGGKRNTAGGTYSTVSGGGDNSASGQNSTVPGGNANTASGDYSFAAGRQAKANHKGAFVWADSQAADFASTTADSFLIRAQGGVGIGTASPGHDLDVAGRIRLRQGSDASAGAWFYQTTPAADQAFVGMMDDTRLGLWGSTGAGWGLIMNTTTGDIGVGTLTPAQELDVVGDINLDFNGAATTNGVCHSGADEDVSATNRDLVVCSAAPGDVAEWYETTGVQHGDIVAATPRTVTFASDSVDAMTGQLGPAEMLTTAVLTRSSGAYQGGVLGVVSTSPVQTIGKAVLSVAQHPAAIALAGRAPVRVTALNGPIQPGDPITSSPLPGVGMKATEAGRIVGYALDHFAGPGEASILVLVDPGWHGAATQDHGPTADELAAMLEQRDAQLEEQAAHVQSLEVRLAQLEVLVAQLLPAAP